MSKSLMFTVAAATVSLAAVPAVAEGTVTVQAADGLHDGPPNWYQNQFDAFTKATGIKVLMKLNLQRRISNEPGQFLIRATLSDCNS